MSPRNVRGNRRLRTTPKSWRFGLVLSALTACDRHPVPAPSFEPVFPAVRGEYLSNSSPVLVELDGDGVPDIVFGTGVDRVQPYEGGFRFGTEPAYPGAVTAVSGATNQVLWKAPHAGEAYTTPRVADLNGDRVSDIVMGGREGAFAAYSGADGAALWRIAAETVADSATRYGFFTPALLADVNQDGVSDLAVMYGGDDTRRPHEPRATGHIVLVSGANGAVLKTYPTPDSAETYSAIITYQRANGAPWLIFGTGGETFGGAAYRAPVAALVDGTFLQRVERLIPAGAKGVMAPATLVDLNGDAELDIVISTFDGRLFVLDGASGRTLWQRHDTGEETYHPAAVMRIAADGRLGLIVSRGIGVFPGYLGTVHRVFDIRDGRLLYQYRDPLSPAGAPLAVDLNGDGVDEPFFFCARGRVHIHHGASGELIIHDIPAHLGATPLIADPRRSGTLELIGVAWENAVESEGLARWQNLSSQLIRLNLGAAPPAVRSWAGYMGTDGNGRYPPARSP